MRNLCGLTLVGTILALATASEGGIERNGVGAKETIECGGEWVELNGASSDLTLLGDCPHVEVNGSSNTVRIEEARHIEINGMGNTVIWERGANGRRPHIETSGIGNTARQGRVAGSNSTAGAGTSASPEAPRRPAATRAAGRGSAIAISENRQTRTIACVEDDVTVDGNFNTLRLTGECDRVEVSGNGNVVRIEAATVISVLGNKNRVTWSQGTGGSAPKVTNLGNGNDVARASE